MAKYRKKPVVVEAEQFWPDYYVPDYVDVSKVLTLEGCEYIYYVTTIHNTPAYVMPGDWIIKEPDGIHYYPCKPDIFEKTYELVED